ncbi:MAG: 30S ribosomal protein S15 [Candidatus Paceibacterota bacterium]
MAKKVEKVKIVKEFARKEGDTGSPEVQIALLTQKITDLADHLKKNRKDKHSRRGLLQVVADRQSHLNYLKKKNTSRYNAVVKKAGLKR